MIKLNFEDWKKQYINVTPEAKHEMETIHHLEVDKEIDSAVQSEYAFYEGFFNETLRDTLQKTVVSITFRKVDGTKRTILSTLNPMLIPKEMIPKGDRDDNGKESSIICVFEVDLQEWRSFRKDSLIEWHINQATDLGEDA